jgi:S-adenosylmethionine hydrolase
MKPILVFQTDFTYKEGAVCAMYGVVKSVDRELEIIDGTHEIPQYDIWSASYRLYQSMQFWPQGTVFVSVVDPGVGTERRGCVALTTDGYFIVTPDNGTLTHVSVWIGIQAIRQIDESVNRLRGKGTEGSSVFHGRDVFAYCAARLASGMITFEQVGPSYSVNDIICLPMHKPDIEPGRVRGIFEIGDPNFGNLWTNIPLSFFESAGFKYGMRVRTIVHQDGTLVLDETIPFVKTFGVVEKGALLIYTNELMRISLALNQGNLAETHQIAYGPQWRVEFTKSE